MPDAHPKNFFADIPRELPAELTQVLLSTQNVRIERIVSLGHKSPENFWYDQPQSEWVLLLRGAARLAFDDGETVEMEAGDFANIPAHKKHRVEWTDENQPTIWLAIHYG